MFLRWYLCEQLGFNNPGDPLTNHEVYTSGLSPQEMGGSLLTIIPISQVWRVALLQFQAVCSLQAEYILLAQEKALRQKGGANKAGIREWRLKSEMG